MLFYPKLVFRNDLRRLEIPKKLSGGGGGGLMPPGPPSGGASCTPKLMATAQKIIDVGTPLLKMLYLPLLIIGLLTLRESVAAFLTRGDLWISWVKVGRSYI